MNTKLVLAILAGFVWNFLGGWLIFGFLLHDFLHVEVPYEGLMLMEPNHLGLSIFCLSISILIALVVEKTGNQSMQGGLITGLWVGLLAVLFFNGGVYAFMDLYEVGHLVKDTLVSTVFYGITGLIAGVILKPSK
jgi:heme/copper-type cytochrome/quinol oxidase subunit 3